jgi:D-alanine-D-alanine ligase
VHGALVRQGWDAALVEIETFDGLPQRLAQFAVVFNILHGGAGEDGTVQLLLDLLGKPYVGSGPLASALAMDKVESRKAFQGKGLPVPDWLHYSGGDLEAFRTRAEAMGYPLVIKPRREGSSVGVHLVRNPGELGAVSDELVAQYGEFLGERFIPGREVTASVLERDGTVDTLPLVELRPRGDLFDWGAKYTPGECGFVCPAEIGAAECARAQEMAREAHEVLGCRDFSRADIRIAPDGTPYILELNTLPGLTEMSTFPRAAQAIGMSYDALVVHLLNRALARLPAPASLG